MAIKHLVSLGGSFAAGIGMPPWLNSSTMRSSQNYAHLVAQRTAARLTDMSAAGADTSNMIDTWQPSNSLNVLARERLPPQLTGVTEDTDLVPVTAGGADLGYCKSLVRARTAAETKQRFGRFSGPILWAVGDTSVHVIEEEHVQRLASSLERLIGATQEAAPSARIILIDYMSPFGKATRPCNAVPFDRSTIEAVSELTSQLNWSIKLASQRSRVDLIQASELAIGHELGSAEEWITRLDVDQDVLVLPYFPNAKGTEAIADAIIKLVMK